VIFEQRFCNYAYLVHKFWTSDFLSREVIDQFEPFKEWNRDELFARECAVPG
jgi:hypothetical protein